MDMSHEKRKKTLSSVLGDWWAPYRSTFVQGMLLVFWLLVLGLAGLSMRADAPGNLRSRLVVGSVICVCALPKVLCFIASLMVQRGLDQRQEDAQRFRLKPATGNAPGDDLRESVMAQWAHEDRRAEHTLKDRVTQYAGLYGLLSSASLAFCAMALVNRSCRDPDSGGSLAFLGALAASVGAATLALFAIDYGRIIVRAARRDVSVQLLASATRNLLVTLLFAAFAAGLASFSKAAGLNIGLDSLPIGGVLGALVALGGGDM